MLTVFVSYRRDDEPYAAILVNDRLKKEFGDESVFFDVESVPPGIDFRDFIPEQVDKCDVLVVVIGDAWNVDRRLDNPVDFVRIEVETALNRDIPVIPVLVREADIPRESDLPTNISALVYRNACQFRPDKQWEEQLKGLVSGIKGFDTSSIAKRGVSSTLSVTAGNQEA